MTVKIIIPARMDSARLPAKVLLPLKGIPMLEHVRRRCCEAIGNENVFVASGDSEIFDVMLDYKANIIRTNKDHINGTSRVCEAARLMQFSDVLIVQGDEPLIRVSNIKIFIKNMLQYNKLNIFCATSPLENESDLNNKDVVKCITDQAGEILFLFRKSPFFYSSEKYARKIQGLIGFKNGSLNLPIKSQGTVGESESIEQLILLENGLKLKAVEFLDSAPSVNTSEEYKQILDFFNR